MSKLIQENYNIIACDSLRKLIDEVDRKLRDGYIVIGGVTISSVGNYMQVIVKQWNG